MHDAADDESDLDGVRCSAVFEKLWRRIGGLVRLRIEDVGLHVQRTYVESAGHVEEAGWVKGVVVDLYFEAYVVRRDGRHEDQGVLLGEGSHCGAQAGRVIHDATPWTRGTTRILTSRSMPHPKGDAVYWPANGGPKAVGGGQYGARYVGVDVRDQERMADCADGFPKPTEVAMAGVPAEFGMRWCGRDGHHDRGLLSVRDEVGVSRNDPPAELLIRAGRYCREQADELQTLLSTVLETAAPPGAPASQDYRALLTATRSEDRHALESRAVVAGLNLAVSVADHVRWLGALLARPQEAVPLYAHASLARSAVEAAALVAHLFADGQSSDIRLGRGVAFLLADADAAASGAAGIPGNPYMPAPGPSVQANRDRLLALVRQARIETIPNRTGNRIKGIRVRPGGPEFSLVTRSSDLVEDAFPDMPKVYALLSATVHGMPWGLADSARVGQQEIAYEPDPINVAGSVLPALGAATHTGRLVARYRGLEETPELAGLLRRQRAFDEAMQRFGRAHGALAGARPTIARFLATPGSSGNA